MASIGDTAADGDDADETTQFVSALAEFVDCRVLTILRDGRKLVGILRSYDQFANLVLQDAVERIHAAAAGTFADIPRGIFLLRGENVVLLGTANGSGQSDSTLRQVSVEDVLEAQQAEAEQRDRLAAVRARVIHRHGLGAEMESEAY